LIEVPSGISVMQFEGMRNAQYSIPLRLKVVNLAPVLSKRHLLALFRSISEAIHQQ
jgi:hypothetical protein